MPTTAVLSQNSRQGFELQKSACIGSGSGVSGNLRWGCGHVYDETAVGIVVYVRNDPVNLVDPDGRDPACPPGNQNCVVVTGQAPYVDLFAMQNYSSWAALVPAYMIPNASIGATMQSYYLTQGAGISPQEQKMATSRARVYEMLAKPDCAKAIGANDSDQAQIKFYGMSASFGDLGKITQRADGTWNGTIAHYNPVIGWRGITLNTSINWSDPNNTSALDANGNPITYRALDAQAAALGLSSITADQFMELTLLHEFSHSYSSREPSEEDIWRKCFE